MLKPAAVSFGRELSGSVEQLMDGSGPRLMFCVCNKMIQQVSFHHHNKRLLSMLKILNVNCLDVGIVYKIYSKILNLIKNNKNNIILVAF